MPEYDHPDHGPMGWIRLDTRRGRIEGWWCSRCHVIAEPDRADDVFDEHDCDQYRAVLEGISIPRRGEGDG